LRCLTNSSEAIYARVHAAQFNAATAENECKWSATQPQPGVFTFDDCDAVKAAVSASGAAFRLHNLAWGQYNPDWVMQANFTTAAAREALAAHINTLVSRYTAQGGVYAIDVVNEPFSDIPGLVLKPSLPW
jgi:endo-1,4-beta-xylanase